MAGILANSSSKTMTSGATSADVIVTGYLRNERVTLGVTPAGSSYVWALGLPSGSSSARAKLTETTATTPAFTPDIGGTYTITCQVSGGTTYTMRLTALDSAVSEPAEALRFTPRADAQIATPAAGVAVYFSSTQSCLCLKTSTGTVRKFTTTAA